MVVINPEVDPAQAAQGQRGRALPSHGWTWSEAVWASGLRPSVRFVALAVARAAARGNRSNPKCWASLRTLARDTGLALNTVKRAVCHLARVGFLVPDPEGKPHGRRAAVPGVSGPTSVRYLVRFEALTPRPDVAERLARKAPPPRATMALPPRATMAHEAEAEERSERVEAGSEAERTPKVEAQGDPLLSPRSPLRGPAGEGTEGGESTSPRWGPKALSGIAAAGRGLRPDATPREDAHARLHAAGIDPRQIERIAEAWSPEQIADVDAAMRRKRASGKSILDYARLFMTLLKCDYPDGAARFDATKSKGGRGSRRSRDRDEGRAAGVEYTSGHGRGCTCASCMAVVMGLPGLGCFCSFKDCLEQATRPADRRVSLPMCEAHYQRAVVMA
jgi:hypothetical protein